MFSRIIAISLQHKVLVLIAVVLMAIAGFNAAINIPLDAVPDITNNQVQVVTVSPTLAPQEVEQRVTFPIEQHMSNLPKVNEIRSISRYGLSVVTVVFEETVPVLEARQYVREQLDLVRALIPPSIGSPELMPITTGLGEIYQYVLEVAPEYTEIYTPTELRTIQDWIVKRQLAGIPGIVEVSSFGGHVKQYEVGINPDLLRGFDLVVEDVITAMESNNENAGSAYIEAAKRAQYIRTIGRLNGVDDIAGIPVGIRRGRPILVSDIATVGLGHAKRYGAMTMDGKGEVVGGITLMLKGENSFKTVALVRDRIENIQKTLPEGVRIYSYLDRGELVGRTIATVQKNLLEGGIIVILVLVLLLGNLRAGIIVASVIPLALLFAFIMMDLYGVSANLMSLGAIDFGIVVDGAVIIVEGTLHLLAANYVGQRLSQQEMDSAISKESGKIYNAAFFGVLIILVVFLPVISLEGIEGKTFRPMAQVMSFALIGAMLLSLTYVPVASSLFLSKTIKPEKGLALRLMDTIKQMYAPVLSRAIHRQYLVLFIAATGMIFTIWLFPRLGAEFIPTLEEGDLAMQMTIQPGSNLSQSINYSTQAEALLLENFPEVKHVVSKIGTAEVPTDPMAIEDADIMILLKPKDEWVSATDKEELVNKMKSILDQIAGPSFEFTQPIQLRFNELMTGAKTDIAVIIYGEDTDVLASLGQQIASLAETVEGAGDVKLEQTEGLPQALIAYKKYAIAQFGVDVNELNQAVKTAFAGTSTGSIYENERSFDLVARFDASHQSLEDLNKLMMRSGSGQMIPFHQLAEISWQEGPMQISRENAKRRISVGINVRGRDTESLVEELETTISQGVKLPPGYTIEYGGQFENLQAARSRLLLVVPLALALIWVLLFINFSSAGLATLIFSAIPLSAIGGVMALWIRGMPFSISAGIGFIALFGVAVLNGIVLISYFNQLKKQGLAHKEVVQRGSLTRLRPVLMTALVAALGFLPMALSTSAGAEVQKPLATVVIGGLISSTLLTLIVLPTLYFWLFRPRENRRPGAATANTAVIALLLASATPALAQPGNPLPARPLDFFVKNAQDKSPELKAASHILDAKLAEKGLAYTPGNLNLSYASGEINANVVDYQYMADYDLGNVFGINRRLKHIDFQANTLMVEYQQLSLQKQAKLSSAYHKAALLLRMQDRIKERMDMAIAFAEKQELLKKTGEQAGTTFQLAQSEMAVLKLEAANTELQLNTALRELAAEAYLDEITIPDTTGWLAPPPPPDSVSLAGIWALKYAALKSESEAGFRARMTEYYPSPQLGAMVAQIEKVQGLFSWTIGLSIPINPISIKAERRRNEAHIAHIEAAKEGEIWAKQRRVEQLLMQAQHLWKLISQFSQEDKTEYARPWLEALLAGEIDYLNYRQALESYFLQREQEDQYRYQYYLTISELQFLGE